MTNNDHKHHDHGHHDHHQHGDSHDGCHSGADPDAGADGKYDIVPPDYSGTVYTCPMHPNVRDVRNSGCPICGMALEPEGIVVGKEDTSELDDMTRRFWISSMVLS